MERISTFDTVMASAQRAVHAMEMTIVSSSDGQQHSVMLRQKAFNRDEPEQTVVEVTAVVNELPPYGSANNEEAGAYKCRLISSKWVNREVQVVSPSPLMPVTLHIQMEGLCFKRALDMMKTLIPNGMLYMQLIGQIENKTMYETLGFTLKPRPRSNVTVATLKIGDGRPFVLASSSSSGAAAASASSAVAHAPVATVAAPGSLNLSFAPARRRFEAAEPALASSLSSAVGSLGAPAVSSSRPSASAFPVMAPAAAAAAAASPPAYLAAARSRIIAAAAASNAQSPPSAMSPPGGLYIPAPSVAAAAGNRRPVPVNYDVRMKRQRADPIVIDD